jgi:transcriptional regulator with XRE-family HTH domain
MYPNLKLEIFKRGLRQNNLARALGLNEAILSKIINGYREPSGCQKQILAQYLQVDESWLFEKFEANMGARTSSPAHRKEEKESEL